MKARALVLREFGKPLRMETIDVKEPGDDEACLLRWLARACVGRT
jgi:hypothetical protein